MSVNSFYYWSLPTKTGLTVHINMQNDETVETQVTDETQVETQEGQTETVEEIVTEETAAEETPVEETPKEEGVKLSPAEYRHYKKWKDAQKNPAKVSPQKVSPQPNIEETVLLANGMPEQLLTELKAVAAVRKTTLIKAQNDPIFVAVKEKFEKDKRQKDSSLPASRGSGSVRPKKDITTPGLSREEHKKMSQELI